MITPVILKGFRDYLPELMIPRKTIIHSLELIFENSGFVPIDTPALEYTEILLGKGGGETDKQIYRFTDNGDRDVALRFDLTVPLARFTALNYDKLVFPFKCYHIAPVWRGENTQKGRYREFYQCDFDILGTKSILSDIEILLIINKGLKALNGGEFSINVNHRAILNSFLKKSDLIEKSPAILRIIDKIYKIGLESVINELSTVALIDKKGIDGIIEFLNLDNLSKTGFTGNEIYNKLDKFRSVLGTELSSCVNDLENVFKTIENLGFLNNFALNPSITRGLDYYTGIIFESFITDRLEFGSICSGGRYDNLIGLYSKNVLSGIGASFGLDRIISLLEDKGLLLKKPSKTEILILNNDPDLFFYYTSLALELRNAGINTEIYFEPKKLKDQYKFAENKKIKYVINNTKNEMDLKINNIKNIETGEEKKE